MWAVWNLNCTTGDIGHGSNHFTKVEAEELAQAARALVRDYKYWADTVPSSALLRGVDVPQG